MKLILLGSGAVRPDLERWGHITCMLCGRCDDVCPTNIGIKRVTREMVEQFS